MEVKYGADWLGDYLRHAPLLSLGELPALDSLAVDLLAAEERASSAREAFGFTQCLALD